MPWVEPVQSLACPWAVSGALRIDATVQMQGVALGSAAPLRDAMSAASTRESTHRFTRLCAVPREGLGGSCVSHLRGRSAQVAPPALCSGAPALAHRSTGCEAVALPWSRSHRLKVRQRPPSRATVGARRAAREETEVKEAGRGLVGLKVAQVARDTKKATSQRDMASLEQPCTGYFLDFIRYLSITETNAALL
jgi:hypothetical protein